MPSDRQATIICSAISPVGTRRLCLTLILSLAAAGRSAPLAQTANSSSPTVPPLEKILTTLRPGHPRVMIEPGTFEALRVLVRGGGLPARICDEVKTSADAILAAPVSKYEKPDGRRLLSVSRRVLDRVRTLSLVGSVEGNPRYADRAWKELQAAAAFPDWNPSHFLDTAEMTHAFALGYDWLYDRWTEEQRRVLRKAIVSKGLHGGLKVYASTKGWHRNENNWN